MKILNNAIKNQEQKKLIFEVINVVNKNAQFISLRRFSKRIENYFFSGPVETTTIAGLSNLSPILDPFYISSTIIPSGFSLIILETA